MSVDSRENVRHHAAMVEFRKENYFVGFWFVGGKGRDCFAVVYKDLVHRFRYHNDASTDPFDGKDQKNFYHSTADVAVKNEKQITSDMNQIAEVVGLGFGVNRAQAAEAVVLCVSHAGKR